MSGAIYSDDYVKVSSLLYDDQAKETVQNGFKNVQLLTSERQPETGSYGYVCRARCDSLVYAAKVLTVSLFEAGQQQAQDSIYENLCKVQASDSQGLKEECEILVSIKHPNIVQYFGVHEDPEYGIALLMEFMDDNLTQFLDHIPNPLPYYTEVNFCSDIAQALAFLHLSDIVHGNLSSNNVLVVGNFRLKVSDFGMAKLFKLDSVTPNPMSQVFMSPEALSEDVTLSEKGDCFSFGVLVVQILTKKYPKPGSSLMRVEIIDSQVTTVVSKDLVVPEIKRRQDHIAEIRKDHHLLQVALNCLRDVSLERPSASDLCDKLSTLKQTPMYHESVTKYKKSQQFFATHDPGATDRAVKEKIGELNKKHAQEMSELRTQLASSKEMVRILCPGYIQQAKEWSKTWEIDRKQINLLERITVGKFGDSVVCRGVWNGVIPVAVKTSLCDKILGCTYLHEASIMKKFCHPKLIRLLGVCTEGDSILIITKFMKNGNLLHFLQTRHVPLQDRTLVQMGAQIAEGMAYLENLKYMHRALCARNILLDDRLNCKITNFQRTRELSSANDSIEVSLGDRLPTRWTAPEAISQSKLYLKSDVWAFGILLYELMTHGTSPYIGIDTNKVLSTVLGGYRIPHSSIIGCPKKLYVIMLDCWNEDPTSRPTFETLHWMLDEFYVS